MITMDVTKAKIIPERTGPNLLTREYPKLSGFLQGLIGTAPDEVGGGSVLDEDAQSSRKLQALGAKYGFPIGTVLGMLPFGGGVVKAPSVAAGSHTAQRGIVKLPGGNWLSGSVEDAVKGLKHEPRFLGGFDHDVVVLPDGRRLSNTTGEVLPPVNAQTPDAAVNNWIDSQLVKKYIKNDMATERDPLRLMADAWPEKKAAKLADVQARIDALAERTRQLARERGQPEHTLVEMRQLMIPLEKEKALIEATEGLHVDPTELNFRPEMHGKYLQPGQTAVAKSLAGKTWEGASDMKVANDSVADVLAAYNKDYSKENPWLLKVPPDTRVHGITEPHLVPDLGFDHLIDELRNSLNPESGLPKELLLKYQDLPKVTVPQAAERVAQINAWRAAQKREADLLTANNAATVLHKEYPEKGLKWVEMKRPEQPKNWLPDGFSVEPVDDYFVVKGPRGDVNGSGLTKDDAIRWFKRNAGKKYYEGFGEDTLAAALKYEGDQMAHCVGGYCPPVLEGRSRIFSLRDAKGKPHTTIEVNPGEYARADLSEDQFELVRDLARKRGVVPDQRILREALPELPDPPSSIKQIKGFKNGKPDDEYLPYVQDFVKSGKWSDVGDLQNTGLRRTSDALNDMEMQKLRSLGIEDIPEWVAGEDLNRFSEALGSGLKYSPDGRIIGGYASGGLVSTGYNPALVNARAAQLEAELFN